MWIYRALRRGNMGKAMVIFKVSPEPERKNPLTAYADSKIKQSFLLFMDFIVLFYAFSREENQSLAKNGWEHRSAFPQRSVTQDRRETGVLLHANRQHKRAVSPLLNH